MANKPVAKKRKGDLKEDIANLQFGEDFAMPSANVDALLNAEVKLILEAQMLQQGSTIDEQSEMVQNSLEYCSIGPGRFQDQESLTKCKNDLMNVRDTETYEVGRWGGQDLVSFEAAALGNLQPNNAEEAKGLIKSLSRFSDNDVDEMCQIVQRHRAD